MASVTTTQPSCCSPTGAMDNQGMNGCDCVQLNFIKTGGGPDLPADSSLLTLDLKNLK